MKNKALLWSSIPAPVAFEAVGHRSRQEKSRVCASGRGRMLRAERSFRV